MTHNDITKLAYEKITDRYYKARYLGLECIMDITNGYINGTKLCLSSKDKSKRFSRYINTFRYKILTTYYMTNITDYSSDLSINVTDGVKEARGTYLHPILFLDLAIWISPDAYMKATRIISDSLTKETDRIYMIEESLIRRVEAEKKAEAMMTKILIQNEKTHFKIDKAFKDSEESISKIKSSLRRVETRIEKLSDEGEKPPTENFSWRRWWPSRNISVFFKKNKKS